MKNIFKFKTPRKGETFDFFLEKKNVKIERIVSSGKVPNKTYRQKQDEWVLLL